MAFKLNKTQLRQKEDLTNQLREKAESAEELQSKKETTKDELAQSLAEFLVLLSEVESFRDEIATSFREDYDEKSEKWMESDKAGEVDEFISEWEEADFSEPDLSQFLNKPEGDLSDPEQLGLEDYVTILEELPEGVD